MTKIIVKLMILIPILIKRMKKHTMTTITMKKDKIIITLRDNSNIINMINIIIQISKDIKGTILREILTKINIRKKENIIVK